jgi:WD40 repeat protein
LAVLPNGYLASGSYDNSIKIWNTNDGTLIRTFTNNQTDVISDLIVLDNGNIAVSYLFSYDILQIWNPNDGSLIRSIFTPFQCQYMTKLSASGRIGCSSGSNSLSLIDTNEGVVVKTVNISKPDLGPDGLAGINGGKHVAGCMLKRIFVWRAEDLELARTIDKADCRIYLIELSDGNLAAAGWDWIIRIYYTASDIFY